MTEPPVYHPIEEHPWPQGEGWIVAWWNDEYGQWCAGQLASTKEEGLDKLAKMRARNPDMPFRLVKETRVYTREEE